MSIWAITTLGYLALGALVQALGLDPLRYPTSPATSWPFRLFARGDAGHFLGIAQHGYFGRSSDPVAAAFFPGYPLTGRALARMFSAGPPSITYYLVALSLLSLLGKAISAVLLWRLAADEFGPAVATASVWALMAGPYSVFLVSSYSESPFLALALGAWLLARADRWAFASLLAASAAVTRVSGLFLACALLVLYAQNRAVDSRARPTGEALLLAAPFAATASYFAWLHSETGSWTAWLQTERRGWARHTVSPMTAFGHSVSRLFAIHDRDTWQAAAFGFQDTMELLFACAFVAAAVVLVRRRRWPDAVLVGLTAASLLTSSYYLSVPRNLLICFPAWILAGRWIVTHRRRMPLYAAVTCSSLIAVVNVVSMLSDHWSG